MLLTQAEVVILYVLQSVIFKWDKAALNAFIEAYYLACYQAMHVCHRVSKRIRLANVKCSAFF